MNAAEFAVYSRRTWRQPVFRFPAAYYDLLPENYITATGLKLLGDKSGNSGVNVLALNGVVGNYASAPSSPEVAFTGDRTIIFRYAPNDYTPAALNELFGKWGGTALQRTFLTRLNTNGTLSYLYSTDGSTGVDCPSTDSLSAIPDFTLLWFKIYHDVNNGAGGNDVTFYYHADTGDNEPPTSGWIQLGDVVTTAGAVTLKSGNADLQFSQRDTVNGPAAGVLYRVILKDGIDGTIVFDADFSTFTKLAATGTESSANAATVTINTTGDTGARICGARDVVQMTGTKQPSLPGVGALFDGSDDYLKAAAFALAQPETVYAVGSFPTWGDQKTFHDGNAASSMMLFQRTATPQVGIYAGTSLGNVLPVVATNYVFTSVFNAASSSIRLNRNTAIAGNAGASSGNGFTLGMRGDGVSGPGNILLLEVLVFNAAHDEIAQQRMARDEMRKNRIPMAA